MAEISPIRAICMISSPKGMERLEPSLPDMPVSSMLVSCWVAFGEATVGADDGLDFCCPGAVACDSPGEDLGDMAAVLAIRHVTRSEEDRTRQAFRFDMGEKSNQNADVQRLRSQIKAG